jgi:uncharacterized membrane protein YbhN (UPF0104 family)
MSERAARASRLGVRVGAWAFIIGATRLLFGVGGTADTLLGRIGMLVVATVGSFAVFFALVFTLAYAFPPPTDRLEFPGAGRVVWPVVGLLILATAVLVWRTHE